MPGQPRVEQPLHAVGAKRLAERIDQRDVELCIGVGKQPIGLASEAPVFGRPPERHRPFFGAHQLLLLQRVQMLPDRHRCHLQPRREAGRVHGTLGFQHLHDAPARLAFRGRAGRFRHALFLKQNLYKVNARRYTPTK